MENHANQSPAIPKWSALLIEAVTKPGLHGFDDDDTAGWNYSGLISS